MATYGWYETVEQADQYFVNRFGAGKWAGLNETTEKIPLLTTANKRIIRSKLLSLPVEPTEEETEILKEAQAEMAWYLYQHGEDEDARMGLRTQGVVEAGIVEEKYRKETTGTAPLPDIVLGILDPFVKVDEKQEEETVIPFFATNLYRKD